MAVVKCKECGGQVSTKAAACPACGAKRPKQTSTVTWLVLALIVIAVVASCGRDGPATRSPVSSKSEQPASDAPATTATPAWRTSQYKDAMTDEATEVRAISSINGASFDFPYKVAGGSKLHLVFRRTGGELDAFLKVDKGQMLCSYSSCSFSMRVGQGEVQKWTGLQSSTNDSDLMFVRDAEQLEEIVKRGGSIRFGIDFHREGTHAFEFDVSDYPGF